MAQTTHSWGPLLGKETLATVSDRPGVVVLLSSTCPAIVPVLSFGRTGEPCVLSSSCPGSWCPLAVL